MSDAPGQPHSQASATRTNTALLEWDLRSLRTKLQSLADGLVGETSPENVLKEARRLKTDYGEPALADPEVQRLVRLAVWQNGLSGSWKTSADSDEAYRPLGMLPVDPGDQGNAAYIICERETRLFSMETGSIQRVIPFPASLQHIQSVTPTETRDIFAGSARECTDSRKTARRSNLSWISVPLAGLLPPMG